MGAGRADTHSEAERVLAELVAQLESTPHGELLRRFTKVVKKGLLLRGREERVSGPDELGEAVGRDGSSYDTEIWATPEGDNPLEGDQLHVFVSVFGHDPHKGRVEMNTDFLVSR
jgi:hypothetical protein